MISTANARAALRARRSRPVIYLIASSGLPNYGDELIARTWVRELARQAPNAEIILDCHTPGSMAVLLRGLHPRLTVTDTVWRLAEGMVAEPLANGINHVQTAVANPGVEPGLVHGIEVFRSAQAIHLLGGGYVNTIWPHHLMLLAAIHAAGEFGAARTVATGQGLLPAEGDQWQTKLRELLHTFDLVDVRDRSSLELLAAPDAQPPANAVHGGDDAWLALRRPHRLYRRKVDAARRRFIFAIQSDLIGDSDDPDDAAASLDAVEAQLRELIDRWGIRGEDAAFVEGIPWVDRQIFDRLAPDLPGVEFVPFVAIWDLGLPARPGQVWICTRFHFHLLAAAAGASGVVISGRSDYYPVKHQSLFDAGSQWISLADAGRKPPRTGGFSRTSMTHNKSAKAAVAEAIYRPGGIAGL